MLCVLLQRLAFRFFKIALPLMWHFTTFATFMPYEFRQSKAIRKKPIFIKLTRLRLATFRVYPHTWYLNHVSPFTAHQYGYFMYLYSA